MIQKYIIFFKVFSKDFVITTIFKGQIYFVPESYKVQKPADSYKVQKSADWIILFFGLFDGLNSGSRRSVCKLSFQLLCKSINFEFLARHCPPLQDLLSEDLSREISEESQNLINGLQEKLPSLIL